MMVAEKVPRPLLASALFALIPPGTQIQSPQATRNHKMAVSLQSPGGGGALCLPASARGEESYQENLSGSRKFFGIWPLNEILKLTFS
jgi:hypothetical protein